MNHFQSNLSLTPSNFSLTQPKFSSNSLFRQFTRRNWRKNVEEKTLCIRKVINLWNMQKTGSKAVSTYPVLAFVCATNVLPAVTFLIDSWSSNSVSSANSILQVIQLPTYLLLFMQKAWNLNVWKITDNMNCVALFGSRFTRYEYHFPERVGLCCNSFRGSSGLGSH